VYIGVFLLIPIRSNPVSFGSVLVLCTLYVHVRISKLNYEKCAKEQRAGLGGYLRLCCMKVTNHQFITT